MRQAGGGGTDPTMALIRRWVPSMLRVGRQHGGTYAIVHVSHHSAQASLGHIATYVMQADGLAPVAL